MTTEHWFLAARALHIAAGTTALFVGPGAMLTVKGAKWHQTWGKIFVGAMSVVGVTAIPMAVYHPSPFLQLVAVFSFYLAVSGARLLRRDRRTLALDAALCFAALAGSVLFLASGTRALLARDLFGSVSVVFGAIGLGLAALDALALFRPQMTAQKRVGNHIGRMGGAYIATVTAFLVVNNHVLPSLLAWLLPTVVGVPLLVRALRAQRKRHAPAAAP